MFTPPIDAGKVTSMTTSSLDSTHPQNSATVMASAGTGKTWLLVTRLVRLLMQGVAPDTILAITFTRKAAAEMQVRLTERLRELAIATPERLGALLEEQGIDNGAESRNRARTLYEEHLRSRQPVRTATFHAFCQEILRRFPLEADVPPGFELVEQDGELIEQAFEALYADATRNPKADIAHALTRLLEHCGSDSNLYSAMRSFLDHRSDWWAYVSDQENPLAFAVHRLQEQLQLDDCESDLRPAFLAEKSQDIAEFAALLARHATKTNLSHADQLATAQLLDLSIDERYQALYDVFITGSGTIRKRNASKALDKALGAAAAERFIGLHEALAAAVLALEDQRYRQQTLRGNRAWFEVGIALLQRYQQLKSEQRLLDFSDLEWRAYRLLTSADNAHWVQYKLDQRIDHLLVDEFQDTNPTQWRLLLPLLQEMAAGNERQRSVFLVGDAKQSIYGFRRADPQLLIAAGSWLKQHVDAVHVGLALSRRSSPAIMECVNRVFGEGGPLANQLQDFEPHTTWHKNLWGEVRLLPLATADDEALPESEQTPRFRNPLTEARQNREDQRFFQEGRQIATAIQEMLQSGLLIGTEDDARPMRYGDILILVRKRTHTRYLEQALREAHIPYLGADRGTLLESLEVRDMVTLLQLLASPNDSLALATVLRSPLFSVSNQALITLARSGSGPWDQRLQALAEQGLDETLSHAANTLNAWRQLADTLPIHDLLDAIYAQGNVQARYQAAFPPHLHSRVRANLTRFLELALEIDSGRYPSLTHFLDRVARMQNQLRDAPDEAPVPGEDRVQIMTVHGSKGLEAPIVILADTASDPMADRAFRGFVEWPADASKPTLMLLVGRKRELDEVTRERLQREEQRQKREQANLLYVALTRARQVLLISGTQPARTSLNWYGDLQQALQDADGNIETLQWSERPLTAVGSGSSETATESAHDEPLDERLTRSLQRAPAAIELNPSQTTDAAAHGSSASDDDALERGNVIHRLLERLAATDQSGMQRCIDETAAEFCYQPTESPFADWATEAVAVRRATTLAPLFSGEGYCEIPLVYRGDDGQAIYGIIDRVVVSDEQVWLVDYKTHRATEPQQLDHIAEGYRQQLQLYAEGLRRIWPDRRLRASLLFTATAEIRDVPLNFDA